VEGWNIGFSKDMIHLNYIGKPNRIFANYCSIPTPIFPIFQHSTIPIEAFSLIGRIDAEIAV
jgi:hypothetical protein